MLIPPLSFKERGPGGEFKRCRLCSNSPPFCHLPVSSNEMWDTISPLGEGHEYGLKMIYKKVYDTE